MSAILELVKKAVKPWSAMSTAQPSCSIGPSIARAINEMKTKLIDESGEKTFAIIFEKGDEVLAGLRKFAADERLHASHFTGIGAFSGVVLGFFDRGRRDYKKIHIHEQVEVLSLTGDVALQDAEPKIHVHVVVGKSDGTAHGGHLMEAYIFPTLEVILVESPKYLQRRLDPDTGLALIDLEAA